MEVRDEESIEKGKGSYNDYRKREEEGRRGKKREEEGTTERRTGLRGTLQLRTNGSAP